jgi:hypothetical protein
MKSLIAATALVALASTAQAVPTVTIVVADNGVQFFSRTFTNTVPILSEGIQTSDSVFDNITVIITGSLDTADMTTSVSVDRSAIGTVFSQHTADITVIRTDVGNTGFSKIGNSYSVDPTAISVSIGHIDDFVDPLNIGFNTQQTGSADFSISSLSSTAGATSSPLSPFAEVQEMFIQTSSPTTTTFTDSFVGFDPVVDQPPPTAAPEPSSLLVIGTGLLGFGVLRRKVLGNDRPMWLSLRSGPGRLAAQV